MKKIDYRITSDVYDMIINGTKRIEIRLSNEKSNGIEIGDEIRFYVFNTEKYLDVVVKNLYKYKNADDLCSKVNFGLIMHKEADKELLKSKLYNIYPEEDVEKNGLVGIEFILK